MDIVLRILVFGVYVAVFLFLYHISRQDLEFCRFRLHMDKPAALRIQFVLPHKYWSGTDLL